MGIVILSIAIAAIAIGVGMVEFLGVSAGAPWAFGFGPTIASRTAQIARPAPRASHSRVTQAAGLALWTIGPDRALFARPLMQFVWTPMEVKGTIEWVGPTDHAVIRVRPIVGPVVAMSAILVAFGGLALAPPVSDADESVAWSIRTFLTLLLVLGFFWVSFSLLRRRAYSDIQAIISELSAHPPVVEE